MVVPADTPIHTDGGYNIEGVVIGPNFLVYTIPSAFSDSSHRPLLCNVRYECCIGRRTEEPWSLLLCDPSKRVLNLLHISR